MAAPNSSSTRIPARSFCTPPATAAWKASKITRLRAAISAVCSGLNGPCQPNMVFENVARWSKGNTYRGLSYPIVTVSSSESCDFVSGSRLVAREAGGSEQDPQLVQVLQQVGDVAVHAERAGVVEFLFAVPAGQDADAQHAGPPRGDVVPDGVADDDAVPRPDAEPLPARQKEVRLGLALQLPLPLHHNRLRPDADGLQGGVDERPVAGGGDGVGSPRVAQDAEHLGGAGQRPGARHELGGGIA